MCVRERMKLDSALGINNASLHFLCQVHDADCHWSVNANGVFPMQPRKPPAWLSPLCRCGNQGSARLSNLPCPIAQLTGEDWAYQAFPFFSRLHIRILPGIFFKTPKGRTPPEIKTFREGTYASVSIFFSWPGDSNVHTSLGNTTKGLETSSTAGT